MYKPVVLVLFFAVTSFGSAIKPKAYDSRIYGGSDAVEGQFPYQVSLRYKIDNYHECGGSIINSKWILTAAHCFISGTTENDFVIVVGSLLISSGGVAHNVSRIILHEDFNIAALVKNDIALLELADDIEINDLAQPIQLATEFVDVVDAVVSGWGSLNTFEPGPDNLQYLRLPTISLDECNAYFGGQAVADEEICTMSIANVYGMCYGDSGGPLVSDGQQIGIVSWGRPPCDGGGPDVYTRVSSYIDWINRNMGS